MGFNKSIFTTSSLSLAVTEFGVQELVTHIMVSRSSTSFVDAYL